MNLENSLQKKTSKRVKKQQGLLYVCISTLTVEITSSLQLLSNHSIKQGINYHLTALNNFIYVTFYENLLA